MSLYALQLLGCVVCLLFLHTSYSQQESSFSALLSSTSSKLRLLSLQITDVLASCIRKHVHWRIKNHAQGFSAKKFKHDWMPDYRMDDLVFSLPDILYTTSRRKAFHDCTINELPPGRYMFVITKDNEISYGLIEDHWHIGVKHFHLAMRRLVVLAGELWLNVSSSESFGLNNSNPLNGSSSILFTIRSGTFTRNIQKTLVGRVGLNQSNAIMEQCTQEVIEVLLTNSSGPPAKYHYDRASIQPHPMGYLKDDENVVIPSTERVGEFCLFPHFKRLNPFICSYYVPWTSDELMRIQIELKSHEKKWLRTAASYHAKHNVSSPTWRRLLTVSNGSVLIYPSSSSLPHGLFVIEGRSSIFLDKQTLPLSTTSIAEATTNEHLVYVNGRLDTCLITKPYVSEENAVCIIEMNLLKQRQKPSSDDQVTSRMHSAVTRQYAALKEMLLTFNAEYDSCRRKANSTINSASTPSLGCLLLRNEFNQPIFISQPTINYRYQRLLLAANNRHYVQSLRIADRIDRCVNRLLQRKGDQQGWSIKSSGVLKWSSQVHTKSCFMPDYRKADLRTSTGDLDYSTSHQKVMHGHLLHELPPGQYAFVITEDNAISYGLIDDEWRIGVSHVHIAAGRRVVVGGKLWLNDTTAVGGDHESSFTSGSTRLVTFRIRSDMIDEPLVGRVGLNQSNAIMEQCTQEVIEVLLTNSSDPPAKYHYDRASIQPHPMGYLKDDENVVIPSTERVGEFCLFPHFKRLNPFICSYYVPWTSDELMRIQIELKSHEKKWLRTAASYHAKHNDSFPTWRRLLTVSNGSVLIYPSSSSLPHGLFVIEGRSSIFLDKQTLPLSVTSIAEATTNEHLVYVNGRLDTCLITKPYFSEDNAVSKMITPMREVYRDQSQSKWDAMTYLYRDCLRAAAATVGGTVHGSSKSYIERGCALQRNEFNQPILMRYLT